MAKLSVRYRVMGGLHWFGGDVEKVRSRMSPLECVDCVICCTMCSLLMRLKRVSLVLFGLVLSGRLKTPKRVV